MASLRPTLFADFPQRLEPKLPRLLGHNLMNEGTLSEQFMRDCKIMVDEKAQFVAPLSVSDVDRLIALATPSQVGKGSKTVYDRNVRSSLEITGSRIGIPTEALTALNNVLRTRCIDHLGEPGPLKAILHKLIVYRPGDFFVEHFDAAHEHKEGVTIITASVELPVEGGRLGGDLGFPECDIPERRKQTLTVPEYTVFYHDVPHAVTKLMVGNKVTLVFDVIKLPGVIESGSSPQYATELNALVRDFSKLRDTNGFKRLGFLLHRTYILNEGERVTLKGPDSILADALNAEGAGVTFIPVKLDTENKLVMHKAVGSLLEYGAGHGQVMRCYDPYMPENETEFRCQMDDAYADIYPETLDRLPGPKYDTDGEFALIKDEYLLGDVLFLDTGAKAILDCRADDEVYLGNEGAQGSICHSLALIATFK